MNQELSRKQEIIDSIERRMSYNGSKNAAEELQCENLNVSTMFFLIFLSVYIMSLFQINNVGKLNLEQIEDYSLQLQQIQPITNIQLSNLEQLKVKKNMNY